MTVLLRTGREADLAQIGDLHFRSRADAYRDFLSPAALEFGAGGGMAAWWTERWRWERDTHTLRVAADGERVVGFSYLGPCEEPGAIMLNALHVAPELVGTGVGRLLMLDAVPRLGPYALLWVLEKNARARRFYEGGGWRPDGVTRVEAMGGEDTLQLRYELRSGGRGRVTE